MAEAVCQMTWYGASASEPAGENAETVGGLTFNREDTRSGNPVGTALSIPLVTGTIYSWPKLVALQVLGVGTTTIANRRISPASPLPTGCHLYVMGLATYDDPSVDDQPAPAGTDAAVPAGYTEAFQNVPVIYDPADIVSSALGRNGMFASLVLGIDSQYASTGGIAGTIPLPTVRLTYDEGT